MIEVKRCPFCGGEAFIDGSDNVGGEPYYFVRCQELSCMAITKGAKTKEGAARIWNRRVEDE